MADNTDAMAEIRASFFTECEELLESLQDGLDAVWNETSDEETINVIFRAVHSVKGGAGAFGLTQLVDFAHRYETALDEVRAGKLVPEGEVLKLFFRAADILSDLLQAAKEDGELDPATFEEVLSGLAALAGGEEEEEEALDFQPLILDIGDETPQLAELPGELPPGLPPLSGPAEGEGDAQGDSGGHIYFAAEKELFLNGNEPLYLFRALADLTELTSRCNMDDLPDLSDLDPAVCHLSWDLTTGADIDAAAVAEVFEFVEGLCTFRHRLPEPELPELPALPELPILPGATDAAVGAGADGEPGVAPAPDAGAPPQASDAPAPKLSTDQDAKAPAAPKAGAQKPAPAKPNPTIRVDLERVDRLVNLVGELVINQAMLSQSVTEVDMPPNAAITKGLDEFMQLTRSLQDSVMRIRAQPVKALFQRMGRIVREVATEVNKNVLLKTEGETTEVDKTVIERLADPLTHMIRNAVDHGLESTEARLAAGKPERGTVTLTAGHRSGRVVIEISDDGAGINRPKVRQIAIDKKLIEETAELSDSDIDMLLFMPGFSTASEVSNLSGRGVGMDVVKTAIQALGGRVSITSTPGQGTCFSISLPLTLAVLDGMVVEAAGQALVLPLNVIEETMTVEAAMLGEMGRETQVLRIREGFAPLLDLGTEMGFRTPLESYLDHVALLIAHEDGSRSALVVDRIVDQRQVVIKGLQNTFGQIPGVAAATILGDGQIALILDPLDITMNASGRTRQPSLSLAG